MIDNFSKKENLNLIALKKLERSVSINEQRCEELQKKELKHLSHQTENRKLKSVFKKIRT